MIKNVTIRTRLAAGFALLLAVLALTAGSAYQLANQAAGATRRMIEANVAERVAAEECRAAMLDAIRNEKEFRLRLKEEFRGNVDAALGRLEAKLKVIQEVITLVVFGVFTTVYLKDKLQWNHYVGFALILSAVFFVFHKWEIKPGGNDVAAV